MRKKCFIGITTALQITFLTSTASAVVDFDGGTATRQDGSTVVTSNTSLNNGVVSYVEDGVLVEFNGLVFDWGSYIGDYYGVQNSVIHTHWDSLESVTFSMLDGSAFDLNYMDVTSNTVMGGGPADGTEDSWVTASNWATIKLPSVDWGSIQEPEKLWFSSDFNNITSFTVTSTNAFCFGLDNFYINEPPPPFDDSLNLTKDDGIGDEECIYASSNIEYTVCYDNGANDFIVEGVTLTDSLPPEVVYVFASGSPDYDSDTHSIVWDIGDLSAGDPGTCEIVQVTMVSGIPGETELVNSVETVGTFPGNRVIPTTQNVTTIVCPNTPPVAQCADITVFTETGVCTANASVDAWSYDPDGDPITIEQTPAGPYPTGTTTVTLTVSDDNGASDECTAIVTVVDDTTPDIQTQDITVQLDASGNASITASDIDDGTSDACGIASLSVNPSSFTCSDLGANTVTLTAVDVNGNASSATATVTVVDTIAPINVEANAPATITPPDAPISFTATANDNCSVAEVEITDYFCYRIKKDGSQQSKMESCVVSLSGDTITITDSGGVNDNIAWTILATDQSGNTTTAESQVLVVNPGKK